LKRATEEASTGWERLRAPVVAVAASVAVVALTYLFARLVVYLYVFDPFFSLGARQMPSPEEAITFGNFVGLWIMPAAFLGLTLLSVVTLVRANLITRSRDGALFGLTAALLHQIVGLYFDPLKPAEAATFLILGVASGFLGVSWGRKKLDARESLYEASREVAAARDPQWIVSALAKHLADSDVVGLVLYGVAPRDERANHELSPLASWHSPISRGPAGERIGELLLGAATHASKSSVTTVVRADGLRGSERGDWERSGIASALLVPLGAPTGRWVGVLAVASRRRYHFSKGLPRTFMRDETRAYESLGPQTALVLENHRLLEEARRSGRQAGILRERQRLAHEIHDTLAQAFTSVVTNLEAAEAALPRDPSAVRQHHGQLGRAARAGLDETRRLVWALRPAPLEDRPLLEAIGELVHEFSEESGIPAVFSVSGDPYALPEAAEAVLVRVSQEALQNVRKHGGDSLSRVALTLSCMGDAVALDVRDDGVGFDPAVLALNGLPDGGGFGLRAMRERVEGLGGSLVVESSPGEGTAIVAEVPLENGTDETPWA
jgi:signal transduction histidine kinase